MSGFLGRPPGWIESELSAYDFERLRTAEKIEPFGEARADYRAALIILYIASAFSKRRPSFKKIMQMFDFNKTARGQSDEEMAMIFRQVMASSKPRKKRKESKAD